MHGQVTLFSKNLDCCREDVYEVGKAKVALPQGVYWNLFELTPYISSPLKDYYNQVDSLALPNDRQN